MGGASDHCTGVFVTLASLAQQITPVHDSPASHTCIKMYYFHTRYGKFGLDVPALLFFKSVWKIERPARRVTIYMRSGTFTFTP